MRGFALTALIACAIAVAGWSTLDIGDRNVTTGGATLAANAAPAGLVVTSLQTGGPAATAGLQVGDVIDRVDGHRALSPDVLTEAEADDVAILHVAARGDATARTLLLRRTEVGQREDPDRRGR
ncbi:PDZ domain-containing protein [Sphingomonas hankookensis]|uniref:PDZ domain-containing protein n=1 Tax=Sphingomonas hankookensis TaxID=563996 RepID=UPI0036D37609